MRQLVLYIHGQGGSAAESRHYEPLFPDWEVRGLEYRTFTPWETGAEIAQAAAALRKRYDRILLIANSIGATFSMYAGIDDLIFRAYFISPVVDMESVIMDRMAQADIPEEELERRGVIPDGDGGEFSMDYLSYVRRHPLRWEVPTEILYGEQDDLTTLRQIEKFARRHHARLTVMSQGEHWFHTDEQMRFLDRWIRECEMKTTNTEEKEK